MRKVLCVLSGAAALIWIVLPVAARDRDLAATAEHAEDNAKRFADRLDKEMDKLTIDGFEEEDRYEELAEKLRARLDEVHDEVKQADDSEARDELEEALSAGLQINQIMSEYAFSPELRRMWQELRGELNQMASHYGLASLPLLASR